jgi:SAM-dependent methyltransferase
VEQFFATGVLEVEQLIAEIESLCLRPRYERALDFGCGVGRITQALATRYDLVDGVDIADSMVATARELAGTARCVYHVNPRLDLSLFEDGVFDLVYSNITLQHMEPAYAKIYVREFLRVARPGGLVVFQLPSRRRRFPIRLKARSFASRISNGLPLQRVLLRTESLPRTEMHPVESAEVLSWFADLPVSVLEVRPDSGGGEWFESYRYYLSPAQ